MLVHKRRLSKIGEPVGDDKDAGGGKQGLNDGGRAVVSSIQAFVVEQPSIDILHDGADGSEPGAVLNAFVPDHGPDALAQAEPTVIGAVVAGIPCPGSGCAAAARGGRRGERSWRRPPGPTTRARRSNSGNIRVS
jgi:hypothetical protein